MSFTRNYFRAAIQAGFASFYCTGQIDQVVDSVAFICVRFNYSQFRLYGLRIYGLFGHMVRFLLVPFVNGY